MKHALPILTTLLTTSLLACTTHAQPRSPLTRNDWIQRNAPDTTKPFTLIITYTEGEASAAANPALSSTSIHHFQIAPDGTPSVQRITSFSIMGGTGSKLPTDKLTRLKQLLEKLPDDNAQLPPNDRRILLTTHEGFLIKDRLYDRSNLPDEVLDVLRASGCDVGSVGPRFNPTSQINADESNFRGAFRLTPDSKTLLYSNGRENLHFFDASTHEKRGGLTFHHGPSIEGIEFSPDKKIAVVWGGLDHNLAICSFPEWKGLKQLSGPVTPGRYHILSHPTFTPDGQLLLASCTDNDLYVFDTKTWQRLRRPDWIPQDATRYIAASTGPLAVVETTAGKILLWDSKQKKNLAQLDENATLKEAAFAPDQSVPDQSLFATITFAKDQPSNRGDRLRLWRSSTGQLLHELRPFEQNTCEYANNLLWSPDGKFLFAANKSSPASNVGLGLWNIRTGRYAAEFQGCIGRINGIAITPDQSQIIAGCEDGKIRFWNLSPALPDKD